MTSDINNIQDVIEEDICKLLDTDISFCEDFDIPIYTKSVSVKKNINGKDILVMSGGGIKGLSYVGVIKALEELNVLDKFTTMAATSIGSLFASLVILGYTGKELEEFILKFNLGKLKMMNIMNMFENYGLDDGDRLIYTINRLIKAKGYDPDITLGELFERTGKTIYITTVCVNTRDVIYLNYKDHPNILLKDAIRRSVSVPGYYAPVIYDNNMYIDGGCIDNFPIQLFKYKLDRVLALHITESYEECNNINNLETYFGLIYQCFMKGNTINSKKGYEKYTTDINLKSINILNYDISIDKKKELITIGYDTILNSFMRDSS